MEDNLSKNSVEKYFEAWKTNDKKLLLSVFSDEAIWEDPIGSPPYIGLEEIASFWDQAHSDPDGTLNPVLIKSIFLP